MVTELRASPRLPVFLFRTLDKSGATCYTVWSEKVLFFLGGNVSANANSCISLTIALCKGGGAFNPGCRHCRRIKQITEERTVEFLPVGYWPEGDPQEEPQKRQQNEVFLDWGRFTFLKGLAALHKIVDMEALGTRQRGRYRAFVVQAPSGNIIALLESLESNNALYVFVADEEERWIDLATQTKWQVLNSGNDLFVRRIFHTDTWENRVKKYLMAA